MSKTEADRHPHTPGPWAVRGTEGTSVYLLHNYGFSATGWMTHNVSTAQARADASLIAAAPDLLEALRKVEPLGDASVSADLRKALRPHEVAAFDEIIAAVRAAITKAEGL